MVREVAMDLSVLVSLLAGGDASVASCSGEFVLELERCVLVLLGSCMPRDGKESDFLLVL